jgi:SAM-dependent methyltransferase
MGAIKSDATAGSALYGRDYYVTKQGGWSASAEVIVPALLRLFPVGSVVEFGCGTGTWLATFARHGVTDILGFDGAHVPRDLLHVPADRFRAADLATLEAIDRRFDLACSLEYAEHLPPERAASFVKLLVQAAPVVLFSAAVPGQGGLGHLNEQRQSYWAALFAEHGYVPVDCIRPAIWGAPGLDWYYAQNTLVYCLPSHIPAGHAPVRVPLYLDLLDDRVFVPLLSGPQSVRGAMQALRRDAAALRRALARRVGSALGRRSRG